nr:hypothetical protein [Glycomyces terrestris]
MDSRYRVARWATIRSSRDTSQSSASGSRPSWSSPVATTAPGWDLRRTRLASVVVASWAITMAGAPSCESRDWMSCSVYVWSGSSTETSTVNPAALAASSMPRSVSAVPYREVSKVKTVTDRTAPPARVRAERLGR